MNWALRTRWTLCAIALSCALSGCVQILAPDFEELYAQRSFETRRGSADDHIPPPAIVIPGLLGSRLVEANSGREVWPGSAYKVLLSRYRSLALPLSSKDGDTPLIADGITEQAAGKDFYGQLLRTLTQHGGYTRTRAGTVIKDQRVRRVYVFAYDWRQDNVTTAQSLARFLDQIRNDYGNEHLTFDLIAHSMGGLMARYFLRYGTEDVLNNNRLKVTWAGASYINKIVLLGSPSMGSLSAIEGLVNGQKVGLRSIPAEVVSTMPSTFQLFPHRLVDWLYTPDGKVLNRDPFDMRIWQRLQWGIFKPAVQQRLVKNRSAAAIAELTASFERSAERARRFSWSLTVCPNYDESLNDCPAQIAEPPVRLVAFGGDCSLTPARAVLEDMPNGATEIRFRPSQVKQRSAGVDYARLMLDPGDGTVTKPSLLARDALAPYTPRHSYSYFPLAYAFFLCADHTQLTGNVHFQDNLLDLLLTRARPWELHKDHGFAR